MLNAMYVAPRQLIEAEASWPQQAKETISLIGKLYEIKNPIRSPKLPDD